MAAARIAAVFLVAFLPVVGAQQSSQTQLTIHVTDVTRAVVPGAHIEIDPSPPAIDPGLATDDQGIATASLPARTYTLSIIAPGFQKWTRQIDVQIGADRTIMATLEVEPTECNPCITVVSHPDLPLENPEPVFLPLQPFNNLTPLPSHIPKKRW